MRWHTAGRMPRVSGRRTASGLAHRRLAIIDLDGGDQPMGNEDGSVQVVFNGEIYNYQALRQRLLDRGHRFRTRSDTEVLVHLYEEEGDQLVEHLRGMFAFAIWDDRRRQLVLARDRVGQKPLYVYRDDEKLLFASELKGILAHPGVDRSIDARAIADYLTFGVIPGRRCIFRRMEKVPPAHVLSFPADGAPPRRRQYWSVSLVADRGRSIGQWQEAVEAKLAETVSAHRVADVPVGAFLSGGLDSSVIVSQLARLKPRTPVSHLLDRFSRSGFQRTASGPPRGPAVRNAARGRVVTAEAAGSLDDLVHYYDEPFADSSAIPTMHVARLARAHGIKVVLSGDGGDEAFGGYARYPHDLREAQLRRRLPAWLRGGLIAWLATALAQGRLAAARAAGQDAADQSLAFARRGVCEHRLLVPSGGQAAVALGRLAARTGWALFGRRRDRSFQPVRRPAIPWPGCWPPTSASCCPTISSPRWTGPACPAGWRSARLWSITSSWNWRRRCRRI